MTLGEEKFIAKVPSELSAIANELSDIKLALNDLVAAVKTLNDNICAGK